MAARSIDIDSTSRKPASGLMRFNAIRSSGVEVQTRIPSGMERRLMPTGSRCTNLRTDDESPPFLLRVGLPASREQRYKIAVLVKADQRLRDQRDCFRARKHPDELHSKRAAVVRARLGAGYHRATERKREICETPHTFLSGCCESRA